MADNNRNWGGYRSSNQDWDDDNRYRNEDDRNSSRGRYEGGHGNDWGRSGQDYGQGSTYGESRYDRDRDRDNDYNRGSNYGGSNYGGYGRGQSDYGSYGRGQSDYGRDYSSWGSDRNRGDSSIGGSFGFGETGGGFRSRYDRERQSYSPGGYQNYGGGSGYGSNQWTGGYGGSSYGRNMGNNYGSGYGSSDYGSGGYGTGMGDSFGRGYGSSGYGDRYGSSYDRNYGSRSGSSGYGNNWDRRDFDRDRGRNEDRGWWDRTTDEISSWFGDEEAERRRRMDRMHKGRGPKNYQRSDERIKEDINDRLSDDWFVDASEIDVTVQNGEVTLTGTVDERTSKRRAEDIAESVSGVHHVENRLRVSTNMNTGSSRTSSGTSSTLGSSTGTTGVGATTSSSSSARRQTVNENK